MHQRNRWDDVAKSWRATGLALVCVAGLGMGEAGRGAEAVTVEELRSQLRRLEEEFAREQARHREQLEALRRQIEALQGGTVAAPATVKSASVASSGSSEVTGLPGSGAGGQGASDRAWMPSDPVRLAGKGSNYLNLSLDGLFAVGGTTADEVGTLELGGHDPQVNGFTLQNLEATLDGAVDPYFRAEANLIFQIDSEGESRFELEEAYLATLALPANLQVKAGQFYTELGRHNPTHPHTWSFVDAPLVSARLLGPDGLRNLGARVSWLVPTPFYSELLLAVQNSGGETAYSFGSDHEGEFYLGRPTEAGEVSSVDDMLWSPRYVLSLDLSDTQTLLMGASAALGPNGAGGGEETRTQVYGVDLFWKWKPVNHHRGFPFVGWQTEGLWRRYEVGPYRGEEGGVLPGEVVKDYGFYTQWLWGFRRGWVAGVRVDRVAGAATQYEAMLGPDPERDWRWRVSPNLTWYPSEYSRLRLQYNYDDRREGGVDHSVWLQFEFLLGAHAAHVF